MQIHCSQSCCYGKLNQHRLNRCLAKRCDNVQEDEVRFLESRQTNKEWSHVGRQPLRWRSESKVTMATSSKLESGTPTSDQRAAFFLGGARPVSKQSFRATGFSIKVMHQIERTFHLNVVSDLLWSPWKCFSRLTPRFPLSTRQKEISSSALHNVFLIPHTTSPSITSSSKIPSTALPPHPSLLYSHFIPFSLLSSSLDSSQNLMLEGHGRWSCFLGFLFFFFVNGAVAFELLVQCALVGGKKEVSILILWWIMNCMMKKEIYSHHSPE